MYDSDRESTDKRYDRTSYLDVLSQNLGVMDSTAASLCMVNNVPIIVLTSANGRGSSSRLRRKTRHIRRGENHDDNWILKEGESRMQGVSRRQRRASLIGLGAQSALWTASWSLTTAPYALNQMAGISAPEPFWSFLPGQELH